jgi:hypothetical protein
MTLIKMIGMTREAEAEEKGRDEEDDKVGNGALEEDARVSHNQRDQVRRGGCGLLQCVWERTTRRTWATLLCLTRSARSLCD